MREDKKKTTTPVASVGADAGQSNLCSENSIANMTEDFNPCEKSLEELLREMKLMEEPNYLHTVSMRELYQKVYTGKPAIIDGLLNSGAYILAGAPKIGKSFLVAQLAYHVSTGQKLWNYDVQPAAVLYLALEDDFQRLQARLFRMFGVNDTEKLFFAVAAKQLGKGLDEQLERFVSEHPDTKLIILDTLQKVREMTAEGYSYSGDYEVISRMKLFADRHGLCVLFVHHTRKQPSPDNFEMISGTTGLLGCADGAFLMQKEKRTSNAATLDIVGRDQPDQRLYIERDNSSLVWKLDHADLELWREPPDPVLEAVAVLVSPESPVWTGSPTELASFLNPQLAPNILTKHLNINAGRLENEYGIKYENKSRHSGRQITLKFL